MSRYRLPGPLIALLGLFALTAAPAPAQTPLDTLVMAKDIGDIITFDPGESFELTAGEILANVYDRIMTFEPEDPGTLTGGVAESHTVSDDGRTITLRIRDGLTFHSGNPVRPEDVEFSLERVVRRGGSPAFILTQLGWNADNVGELVEAVDERHVRINIVEEFSPGLVLHALSAGIGSVVDRELVMAHEQDGDLGAAWLQTKSAGSGPFRLRSWQANESVVLDANPHYRHGAPGVRRVILRHVPEPSAQRLLLERGDVDIARDLTPDLIEAVDGDEEIAVDSHPRVVRQFTFILNMRDIDGFSQQWYHTCRRLTTMPIGPHGEKRPADPIANALHVARLSTGEAEETYVNAAKQAGGRSGRKGGQARAEALTPERRREIAQQAARSRHRG